MSITLRVAGKHLADLSPPLGKPGGPCHVVNRIEDQVGNPRLQQRLVQDVMDGENLSNQEARKIYKIELEPGVGVIDTIEITSHGQYRMDLRKITVNHVRDALASFLQHVDRLRIINPKGAENLSRGLDGGQEMAWVNPRSKLKIVFKKTGPEKIVLLSTYWKGHPDPKPPAGVCI